MKKVPSSKSNSCAVDKYIGTGFDSVEVVAQNIDTIEDIAPAAHALKNIADNLDEIVRLSDNLVENQVTEVREIYDNETIFKLSTVIPGAMELFISGPLVDRGRLVRNDDYVVESATSFRLLRTYPDGTKLVAVQTIVADGSNAVIYDDKTVFNRDVFTLGKGIVLKDKVIWGMTLPPLITYKYIQYICLTPLPVEHVVTGSQYYDIGDKGHIEVQTDRGNLVFCPTEAMALPRRDINEIVRTAIQDVLGSPAREWKAGTFINKPAYQIRVDGVSYLPLHVPFTTAPLWQIDQVNWYKVAGREPVDKQLTSATLDLTDVEYALTVSATSPVNVVNIVNAKKFNKVLFIPLDSNITLVNSDTIKMQTGALTLNPESAYEFYVDPYGVLRQMY